MPTKLEKLQELIKIVNESPSKEEFLANFKIIVDLIKKLKQANKEEMASLDTKYSEIVSGIKENYNKDMAEVKKKALTYCMQEMEKMMDNHKEKMEKMEEKMNGMGDELRPKMVEETMHLMTEKLTPMIPTVEAIEKDLPKLGEPIRDSLELLEGDERLEIQAIKDLREELDELKKQINKRFAVGGGGGVGMHNTTYYDLSSRLNGSTKTFSLPAMYKVIAVLNTSVPTVFRPTTDFTWTPTSITFTDEITASASLAYGQTIIILYQEV